MKLTTKRFVVLCLVAFVSVCTHGRAEIATENASFEQGDGERGQAIILTEQE